MTLKEYANLRQEIFKVIEQKTSWGKLELKEKLDEVLLKWGVKNCDLTP